MTDREFEQCMSAMAAGDRDSLRHIYDAYLKLIYAVVYDTIGPVSYTHLTLPTIA